jgi:hypothetical protein
MVSSNSLGGTDSLKSAQKLVEALYSGHATVVKTASAHPDLVELAIARLEFLGEGNAVEEIRDALS